MIDILTENLSDRDNAFLSCGVCQGVMREACFTSSGEQFCSCCEVRDKRTITFTKRNPSKKTPNIAVRKMVDSLKCSCPLIRRGCIWLGTLKDCEDHLDTCGYVLALCKLKCGKLLQLNELKHHEEKKCPLLITECKHCKGEMKFGDMSTHLGVCPKMPMSCKLKCGVVMYRENMVQHLKQDCGLMVGTCLLGCGVRMTRDELRIHIFNTCVQRKVSCEHCKKDFRFCDMSSHLEMCPKMKLSCELKCGVVLQRDELSVHEKRCPQRIVKCEHCRNNFKSCELAMHLEMCPKMEVSCELKCGVVMCREDVTQHVEQDCVEKEIECPFAKYKCVGLMKRKNLRNHLDEKRIEHLELQVDTMQESLLEEFEIITKQKEKISEQKEQISKLNTTNETMSREMKSLEEEVEILTKLPKATRLDWRITEVPGSICCPSIWKQFQVAGYNFLFNFYNSYYDLQIVFYLQTGLNDGKLKLPFKAEFVTHLSSCYKPQNIKKFVSEVIEVKRERFRPLNRFIIATLTRDEFVEYFFRYGAEFEIFVIFL